MQDECIGSPARSGALWSVVTMIVCLCVTLLQLSKDEALSV